MLRLLFIDRLVEVEREREIDNRLLDGFKYESWQGMHVESGFLAF